MKTNIKLIAVIFGILCFSSVSYAQRLSPKLWSALQQRELKECPYIFEGKVIQQSGKCSVLQITKIYKGSPQQKLGSIKAIVTCSTDGTDVSPGLKLSSVYIIIGYPASNYYSNVFKSISTDNSLVVQTNDWVYITGTGAVWGPTTYKTLDDLYTFFKENGLTVQGEQK